MKSRKAAGKSKIVLVVILVACSHTLLCVASPLQTSDAIVVLGGEAVVRAEHAALLAVKEMAPW